MATENRYRFPENTPDTYHYDTDMRSFDLENIQEQMRDHFGDDIDVSQFEIRAQRIQVTGCSCCFDPTDWNIYLVITRK